MLISIFPKIRISDLKIGINPDIDFLYITLLLMILSMHVIEWFFNTSVHLTSLLFDDSYYDEDQEKLFNEAHVISPFRKMSEVVRQPQVQVIFGIVLIC